MAIRKRNRERTSREMEEAISSHLNTRNTIFKKNPTIINLCFLSSDKEFSFLFFFSSILFFVLRLSSDRYTTETLQDWRINLTTVTYFMENRWKKQGDSRDCLLFPTSDHSIIHQSTKTQSQNTIAIYSGPKLPQPKSSPRADGGMQSRMRTKSGRWSCEH